MVLKQKGGRVIKPRTKVSLPMQSETEQEGGSGGVRMGDWRCSQEPKLPPTSAWNVAGNAERRFPKVTGCLANRGEASRLADREKLLAERLANKPEEAPDGFVDDLESA